METLTFELESSGISNGYIDDRFGKNGDQMMNGVPSRSLPLTWSGVPEGTKCFALVMQDYDAIPVCGFSWIHWTAVIPAEHYKWLPENASLEDHMIVQGLTSGISPIARRDRETSCHYNGPQPPDKDHTYEVKLYALDTEIHLKRGFYLNELYKAMKGHVLAEATLEGIYRY